MVETVDYYLSLPYSYELHGDPDAGWFIRVKELPGCMSQGDTPEEAFASIREVLPLWIETALEEGYAIPEPRQEASLIFSPRMWRRFIKPRLALCYERVREHGGIVGQHSDGMVLSIFPDLIELGLDVFNPLQPSLYDLDDMKRRFGDKLTFYGGVDEDRTLAFGTPEEVQAEVHARAAQMGRGGGYILQSSHTILDDVPLPNIVAYIEACHELAGIDTRAAALAALETGTGPAHRPDA